MDFEPSISQQTSTESTRDTTTNAINTSDTVTRTSTVAKIAYRLGTAVVLTLQNHLEHQARCVIKRASEFATHCNRRQVQLADVVRASSSICMACKTYDPDSNTCELYTKLRKHRSIMNTKTSAETVHVPPSRTRSTSIKSRGGSVNYIGYCGGHNSQCSAGTLQSSCLVGHEFQSGGGTATNPITSRNKTNTQTRKSCNVVNSNSNKKSIFGRKKAHTRSFSSGGSSIPYSGFCGGVSFINQCGINGLGCANDSSSCCSGGGHRIRIKRTNKKCASRGGVATIRDREMVKQKDTRDAQIIHIKYIKTYSNIMYDVTWTHDAIKYLNNMLRYHLLYVIEEATSKRKRSANAQDISTPSMLTAVQDEIRLYRDICK